MFGFGKSKVEPEKPKNKDKEVNIIDNSPESEVVAMNIDNPKNEVTGKELPQQPENPEVVKPEKKGFFSKVGDAVGKGYDATKKGVSNLAGKAKDGISSLKDKTIEVKDRISENRFVKKYGIDVYNEVKEKVAELKEDLIDELKNNQYFKDMKFKLNKFIILKLEKIIDKQLSNLAEKIKVSTDDPDMPKFVKKLKDDLIDEFYPDLKEEIMFMLKMEVSQPYLELEEPKKLCCLFQGLRAFRAWILYTLDPVDMSIWKRMKTFSYWILQIVQNFPLYGVQTFFEFFYFLLMCKSDEYQLVNYIVTFKKMQFFTIGCLGGLIAYIQYFFCITTDGGLINYYDVNRCATQNESDPVTYWIEIGTFFLKIFLVWMCYIILPCSSKLGMPLFRIQKEEDLNRSLTERKKCCNCSRGGGRLRALMYWELFASLLTIGAYFILTELVINSKKVSKRESIYFCQTLYGLLSFPFLIFSIPMMMTLLTKTRDTKYDKFGRCVPDIPNLSDIKEKEKRRDERIKKRNGIKEKDGTKEDDQDFESLLNDENADIFAELENADEADTLNPPKKKENVEKSKLNKSLEV